MLFLASLSYLKIYILITASRPVATEEQLSADFRKKLQEWQKMKGGGTTKQPPPVPARQDLSDDFLKRWGKNIPVDL